MRPSTRFLSTEAGFVPGWECPISNYHFRMRITSPVEVGPRLTAAVLTGQRLSAYCPMGRGSPPDFRLDTTGTTESMFRFRAMLLLNWPELYMRHTSPMVRSPQRNEFRVHWVGSAKIRTALRRLCMLST